ncbi:MAG: GntR family transcriptional regulator [Pseudomonadota bacterium]|nr:GntR family transcriptional regulator [Pseudomonadota bacterium]
MWSDAPLVENNTPLWAQVANVLRKAIESGEFPVGASLPTEAEINKVFGVSRTTSRAAMRQLVSEGLVARQAGHGTTVLDRKIDTEAHQIRGFSEDMQARGLTASYEVMDSGFVTAPGEASQALGTPSADQPFYTKRLLKANGRIIGVSHSYLRPDIFAEVGPPSADLLGAGSLYDWLRANTGTEITGGVEFIEAGLATAETHAELDLAIGDPVLIARRTAHTSTRLPIEFAVITYRADRYRFRIEL